MHFFSASLRNGRDRDANSPGFASLKTLLIPDVTSTNADELDQFDRVSVVGMNVVSYQVTKEATRHEREHHHTVRLDHRDC